MKFRMLAVAAAMVLSASAHAASPVFTENWDEDWVATVNGGLNFTPPNWHVSDGTVDIVPEANTFYFLPAANGEYIDLDGSTGQAGTLWRVISVAMPSGTYTMTFELAGNARNGDPEVTTVKLGDSTMTFTPSSQYSQEYFTITGHATGGQLLVSFSDDSHDNQGALLDNISISAVVPEPGNVSLILAGLAALGVAARRRRQG